jgi:spore germination cell wall hydrolase CwlJ-like protein
LRNAVPAFGLLALCVGLAGCLTQSAGIGLPGGATKTAAAERDCLIRAMYFESNRSSSDGLLAVGTVVMNRVASPRYPDTICGVVSEKGQFAPHVMRASMSPRELPLVERTADSVLAGKRYKPIGNAMHFHVAGLKIPYNVRYMTVAGGNAFYVKLPGHARGTALANATPVPGASAAAVQTASTPAPPAMTFSQSPILVSSPTTAFAGETAMSKSAASPGR